MRTAIVLFTRDLRVHDNPTLAAAADEAERVLPLFVLDDAVLDRFGAPNRLAFLGQALRDLRESLGGLAIRRGDAVGETVRLAGQIEAESVFLAEDGSAFAERRERRLREQLDVRTFPSTSVVDLDDVRTSDGGAYKVFTPYWRAWRKAERRSVLAPPRIRLPEGVDLGEPPDLGPADSPGLPRGGETEGRKRLERFLDGPLAGYEELADQLAADATSRLSPYLHFGCLSPLEVAERAAESEAFVRQLCWRDFFLQLLVANPRTPREDYRERRMGWRDDPGSLAAWREGRTGYPIVDAAMRQLAAEGWMHNRARLIVGSFLTKTLQVDWREGAAHFFELLVDGDLANNVGNWQWVAGTGVDPRPNRVLNPIRQAKRFDRDGEYVRRYVPELAEVEGNAVHEPWKLASPPPDYPKRIVDHDQASARFAAA
ncbi:MAG: cryptochrome/photolyase family protein [Gaiellaceae bacterium]